MNIEKIKKEKGGPKRRSKQQDKGKGGLFRLMSPKKLWKPVLNGPTQ